MKKVLFNLEVIDGYPPVSMESIWAEVTEEAILNKQYSFFIAKKYLWVILLV